MPGLKKANRLGARRTPRFEVPPLIVDHTHFRTTAVGRDEPDEPIVVQLGLDCPGEVKHFRAVLELATGLRLGVADELMALDIMQGSRPLGRILTNLCDDRLAQLAELLAEDEQLEVETSAVLDGEQESPDSPFEVLPLVRVDVPLDRLVDEPKFCGAGPHQVIAIEQLSGRHTVHCFHTVAEADAFVESTGMESEENEDLRLPDLWELGLAHHQMFGEIGEDANTPGTFYGSFSIG